MKKDHYYAIRLRGKNGDLILGRVKSVRTSGEVILNNLLTGGISTKQADVLQDRNKRISKKQADKLLALFKEMGDKQKVREAAVLAPVYGSKPKEEEEAPDKSALIKALVRKFVNELVRIVK